MKIAVDCDEVLAGLLEKFIMFHNREYGTSLSRKDFHSYYLRGIIGITFDEEKKRFSHFLRTDYFRSIQPILHAKETLGNLRGMGFEMEVVTSRPPEMIDSTHDWIWMHYKGIFSKVHFSENHALRTGGKTKGEICHEIGADFMIEDDLKYIPDITLRGIKVLLYDAPWNRNYQQENVVRVNSWKDIEKYLVTSRQVQV